MIRHAEAEGNLYRRLNGQHNGGVTVLGWKQIKFLEDRFKDVHIDAAYSSDLARTRETAQAIYVSHELTLTTDARLREVDVGIWEDTPWGDIQKFYPEEYKLFSRNPAAWRLEGAETFEQIQNRMISAITEIAEKHDNQTVAVVSHGMAIRIFLCGILASDRFTEIPNSDNTAVTVLDYEDGKFNVGTIADNSHLPEEFSTFSRQRWWTRETTMEGKNLRFIPVETKEDALHYEEYCRETERETHWSGGDASDCAIDPGSQKVRVIALVDDEPAGAIELTAGDGALSDTGRITFCFMESKYRGYGLAVQLVGYAIAYFRTLGRKKIRLSIELENQRAIAFFKKYGFEAAEENEDGKVVMEKNIELEPFEK